MASITMAEGGCRLFSVAEAAEYLKVSRPTLYVLMRTGKLPYRVVLQRRRFTIEDLESFVASTAVQVETEGGE